jgi:hypothetical protein
MNSNLVAKASKENDASLDYSCFNRMIRVKVTMTSGKKATVKAKIVPITQNLTEIYNTRRR